jgi:hypothetical protein
MVYSKQSCKVNPVFFSLNERLVCERNGRKEQHRDAATDATLRARRALVTQNSTRFAAAGIQSVLQRAH